MKGADFIGYLVSNVAKITQIKNNFLHPRSTKVVKIYYDKHFPFSQKVQVEHDGIERIWPLDDSPCVFPDDVVLCEYKERPVHGKAVLSVGYWVIQSHGPGPLRLGLLHGSRESRRVLCVPAALHVSISGLRRSERGLVSKPSHSSKEMSRAPGLKGFLFQDFH